MVRLEIAALYAGVNILLLLFLAMRIPMMRGKHKVSLGHGDNPDLLRAIRAHGNAAEYIPAGLVGIVLIALMEPATPLWLLHASGLTLTIGRILHGGGLMVSDLNAGRMFGQVLTFISFLLIGGGLIFAALAQSL
ncbi:MAG: MAPEG family protein [Caulobacterales bacterium]